MIIIKPKKRKSKGDIMDMNNEFYQHSHAYDFNPTDYTLCGVASEEWSYTEYKVVKKITCPDCLAVIRECKSYKL